MKKKIILIVLIIAFIQGLLGFSFKLPEIIMPQASVIYDIHGRPIQGLAQENRINVKLEEISQDFLMAIIAIEDKSFYSHYGIDMIGMLRAMLTNIRERKVIAGGSTISQQTAKNLFLTNERTILRKVKELIYAVQLEREYSKDEILNMYVNTIYFGQGAYGVEVASLTYFDKSSKDLSLAEAALLAGLPRWPANYNPYINPDEAKKRQAQVLLRMQEENYISSKEREEALAAELNYKKADFIVGDAPYFIAMVKDYLIEKYDERLVYQGGLKVYTSLDLDMQKAANTAFQEEISKRDADLQGALIAINPQNGYILSMIGGRSFRESSYNRVFSLRQPGSTFKPFVYSLAFEWGLTPADMVMCEEVEFVLPNGDIYKPRDYGEDHYHWKEFTLKEAMMISDNIVAVKLNEQLGAQNSANHAEKFGLDNIKPVLSLPLGSNEVKIIDMAYGYAAFANQGIYSEPIFITKIEDMNGTIMEEHSVKQRRVVSPENAMIITDLLQGVFEPGGTGSHLKSLLDRPAAGKTGTTDLFNDAWFVGYTPQIVSAVWIGYDQDKNVNLTGGAVAGPIWANFLREASYKLNPVSFEIDNSLVQINICLDSGKVATEYCPRKNNMIFKPGTEAEEICFEHLPIFDWQERKQQKNDDKSWWRNWFGFKDN